MSATFSIIVNAVRTTTLGDLVDVVKQVDWTLRGEEAEQTFDLPQSTVLPDADPENFVSFADLTSAQVAGWIESYEDGRIPAIKQHIQFVLDREVAKAALESKPLPWAPAPEPVQPVAPPTPA